MSDLVPVQGWQRTAPAIWFADPYKMCEICGGWIDGALEASSVQTPVLIPCGHSRYRDVCPSWSPVNGCGCAAYSARHPHNPISHRMRWPLPGDTRRY